MSANWWEIGKPVQEIDTVSAKGSIAESDTEDKAKQNWWEIGRPVEEPAQTEAAPVRLAPTTPGQGAGMSFQDLFGGPITPQIAEVYKTATRLPGNTLILGGKEVVNAVKDPKTYQNLGEQILEGIKQTGDGLSLSQIDSIPDSTMIPMPSIGVETPSDAMAYWKSFGINSDAELKAFKQSKQAELIENIQSSKKKVQELTPEGLSLTQRGLRGGIESVAIMAPGAVASAATRSPIPVLTAAGTLEGFSGYGEARTEGKSPASALAYGGINSAIEVLTEVAPTGKLLSAFGVKNKSELKDRLLSFAVAEMGTEQAATALQTLNAVAFGLDEELANANSVGEIARIQAERQALTAISTIVAGGTQAGAIGLVNRAQEQLIRRNIEAETRDIEGIGSAMEIERIMKIRSKALDDAQAIAPPSIEQIGLLQGQQPNDIQYGTTYAQRIFDSVGNYVPENAEFKIDEKDTDIGKRYIVVDQKGRQFGQSLVNQSQAVALSDSLNNIVKERSTVLESIKPIQESLQERLKGFGLNDIGLSIDRRVFNREGEALTSEGLFDPVVRRVFLAVDAIDPDGTLTTDQRREALRGVLRHEVVHALRYLDLWKKSEWNNLEKAASTVIKPGTGKTYLQIAQDNYSDATDVIKVEESVADLIRDVADRQSNIAGRPRTLSERAINFFDKAKNAVTGSGFQTYEDIVQRFEQGDIGARERGRIRTYRATEERLSKIGKTPERVQRLFATPQDRNQFRQETVQKVQQETPAVAVPAINSLRLNALRESRSTIDPVPPKITVDEQEVPTRDSEGRLIYSGSEGPDVFKIPTRPTMDGLRNFWNWFGKSKAVDNSKRPLVYYHGTAADITAFQPKQAGSVFMTRSPRFAEEFSALSENYMVENFPDFMSDEQVIDVLNETLQRSSAFTPSLYDMVAKARDKAVAEVSAGKAIRPYLLEIFKEVAAGGRSSRYLDAIQKRLPSGANLMPVYVRAEKPWDYDNKDHIKAVVKRARDNGADITASMVEEIGQGNWQTIEGSEGNAPILDAIRELGYDSMFVEEGGQKNLAVFDPGQIKSAIGNNGDFSPLTPSIRESRKEPTYNIVNSRTGEVVGQANTIGGARRAVDRRDNQYGAYVHTIQTVDPERDIAARNVARERLGLPPIERESRGSEPVSPLQGIVTPEEAEGRIRRRMEREPGVGAPRNERIEFTSPDGKRLVVGKITTADWLERVTTLLTMPEIQDARAWYRQLSDALRPLYGPDASKWALAWLMSQKRASPTKGFTDVLRASDIARGKIKVKGAGLNEQALIDILRDRVPEGGVGPKLLDFLDSELGKVTRTVVRGDVRGRQPAAIDVWAQRDIGFIDETTLEFIRKVFGEQAASQLQVDKTTGGETQYEYGIDFYNNVAEMLNGMRFDGGGWTAAEVQAVGWVTMQRAMGIQAEFVRDIIGGNTRRISIGLAPGANSILADKLAGKEIPPEVAQREIQTLADLAGIKVKQNVAGVGAYLQWVEGAIQIDAVASPEAVDDFMDMVGYVFQQTEVINTRSLASGKNMAIDIMAPAFSTVDGSTSFFSTFLNYAPKDKNGDPLAPGFQQINVDGMPGIRLLNFAGNWRKQQAQQILDAANKAAADLNVQLNNSLVSQVVLTSTKNDWSENKDGQAYLSSLRNRGRLQEVELLQRRYPPSRIDIQGDGSILWGAEEAAADATAAVPEEGIVPAAREARRRGTPIGPTQPGPTNDTDNTSAAEALNGGQPVDSIGTPSGPTISDTEPDGTVDISGARIAPLTRRLVVQMIQSAPDKLRSGIGLDDLAKRVENYYDTYASRLGVANGIIRDAFKRIDLGGKTAALTTFEEFIRARENGRTDDAQSILDMATDSERQLIDAWNEIARQTGEINTSIRTPDGKPMRVWDAKRNEWRPIRSVRNFFPRAFRREVMEVMQNPDLDPVLWQSLLDSLVEAGVAETTKGAEKYLLREWFSDEVAQDYFAGVEKARTEPLPEIFYDYSWDAATRYLRKWSRRTAQIENFGQTIGKFQKEWFDKNIPKVRDQETQNYLNAIKERIYEIEQFNALTNMANWFNSLATGLMLGNWVSASLNLLGGTITNVQEFGIKEIGKSYIDLVRYWKNVQEEGTTFGILNKDFLNILNDHVEMDADKYFSREQKISQGLAKFTNVMLTVGLFNSAENVVRSSALLAAHSRLNKFLRDVNEGRETKQVQAFREWVKRENLDIDALILENGAGKETERFMRRAVNVPQGSYSIDMTPVFIDTGAGRFLLKYQKFGTQINRFFYNHFLKPIVTEKDRRGRNIIRALGFVGTAIIGGAAIAAIRELVGYGDPGPDLDELDKALIDNEDIATAWSLLLSRAWQNIMTAGSLGFFANYAQFAKDWQDQQRVKNPFSPPGLASVDAVIDVFNRLRDQGKLTARDLDEIAETTVSFYRAGKRTTLAAMDTMGSDAREVRRFAAQKEIREVQEYGRRYSEAMDIEFKQRTAPGTIARTPMTPVNKAITDALQQGDAARARLLVREAVRGLRGEERDRVEASIRASVRNRQPIQIGGSAPSQQELQAFMRWSRQNLPAEKYQMIRRADMRYRRAASRAGVRIGG